MTGFSTFFIDVAMGILTILFNRQIVKYLGTDALAVYGIVVNISTFVQCCAYSMGQAAQPIISTNFGAGNGGIIRCYTVSFLLLPLNIFSTYYFQAMLKPKAAFIVSVARGLVISGIFIYLLPGIAGADSIWFAMVFTEAIVAVYVVNKMLRYTREISVKTEVSA